MFSFSPIAVIGSASDRADMGYFLVESDAINVDTPIHIGVEDGEYQTIEAFIIPALKPLAKSAWKKAQNSDVLDRLWGHVSDAAWTFVNAHNDALRIIRNAASNAPNRAAVHDSVWRAMREFTTNQIATSIANAINQWTRW